MFKNKSTFDLLNSNMYATLWYIDKKNINHAYSQIWLANFPTLREWERTGAIQDEKYLKWQ